MFSSISDGQVLILMIRSIPINLSIIFDLVYRFLGFIAKCLKMFLTIL